MCTRKTISWQQHNKRHHPTQAAARLPADANPQPQPAGSQDHYNGKLVLLQLNRLHKAFKRSQVSPPVVFQRSGPAHSAQAQFVATQSHPAAHQGMAPVHPPALRGHSF